MGGRIHSLLPSHWSNEKKVLSRANFISVQKLQTINVNEESANTETDYGSKVGLGSLFVNSAVYLVCSSDLQAQHTK